MRVRAVLWVLCYCGVSLAATIPRSPEDWVDPHIGTAGGGQTFPATGVPFGMTQWTPQTRSGEVKCVAPYYARDKKIEGFRGTHFMSGSCTHDYGSMTLMPLSGPLLLGVVARASEFSAAEEVARPYRYAVTLSRYGIGVEMTGTARAGMLRFRFARGGKSWLLVQSNAQAGEGSVSVNAATGEIAVTNPVHRLYAGQGKPAGITGYFVVELNHAFHVGGTWSGGERHAGAVSQQGTHGEPGTYLSFDLKPGETVEARVGSSFTSLDEARRNLKEEIPGWDYNAVEQQAQAAWAANLNKLQAEGSAAHLRILYTALYHSLLLPSIFSDADGSYPSFAGGEHVETAKGFTDYDDFSLWDTFRAEHPLLTILEPERDGEMVRSLIEKGEQGGFLPIYPAWNSYTSEMIGDHAGAVITDAYFKGIGGFDIEQAYRLMRKNAMELPADHAQYVDGRGRRALDEYLKLGYVPLEDNVPDAFHRNEQVSRTMEYAYDDFLVSLLARSLGKTEDAALFAQRSENYRKVIDPVTGFARGRHADGSWVLPFNPGLPASYVTEGLPYQYTFFAPQNIPGLITAVGGRDAFVHKLDTLFAKGYYDQGNEPSHDIAYLYDFAGAAWKTQKHVHEILTTQYKLGPYGLPGNDDCGQISAWYILSSLGIYPVTPGVPRYALGAPQFDEAKLSLPGGKTFVIRAPGAAEGRIYVRSVRLNGVLLEHPWIDHKDVVAGGELMFEMSATPVPGFGAGK
jgi:predicted alpha-1,2-mannosidase